MSFMKAWMLVVFFSIFLLSCTEKPSDYEVRVDILYEHTIQMPIYADAKMLDQIGLDMSVFPENASGLIHEEKAKLLQEAYGAYSAKITHIESKMDDMMERWVELQQDENHYSDDGSYSIIISENTVNIGGVKLESYTYNDSVPGPLLEANVNDERSLTFYNAMDVAT